jgi:hypothetical protein
VNAQVNGYAPASVDVSWNAPSNTGGGGVRYDVRIDGGAWQNSGQDRTHRFTGVGAGSHTVAVRAVNLGSGSAGTASSDSFGVQTQPPPTPSGTIFKGSISPTSCSGCRYVGIDYRDFPAGSYRITTFINGSNGGLTENTYTLSSNGSVVIWNSLGIRNNDRIQVRFTSNANGNVYWSDPITNWDALPVRGGTP